MARTIEQIRQFAEISRMMNGCAIISPEDYAALVEAGLIEKADCKESALFNSLDVDITEMTWSNKAEREE